MDVHRVYAVVLRRFRRRRMRAFARIFEPDDSTTILDVGGSSYNWQLQEVPGRLTLVNLVPPRAGEEPANGGFVVSSGTALAFADGAFDVAFSNSVIEHLGSFERQAAFARELSRVGRGLFVQTPARHFFFEPHLLTPFVHWLPLRWQRRLLRHFTVWGWLARPTPEQIERHLGETRLLDLAEFRRLFPGCEVRRERFLGLTKSYVAVRHVERVR